MHQKEDVNLLAELSAEELAKIAEPTVEELNRFQTVESPTVEQVSFEQISRQAAKLHGGDAALSSTAVMELTARKPYHSSGRMDFYRPGRWDSTYNQIYLSPMVYGPLPGQWEGTVGYMYFKAPVAATYIVAVNFTGYQTTMKMNGPWGTATGYTATASTPGTVLAIWTATAGANLYFTISCSNLGFLQSVQIYKF